MHGTGRRGKDSRGLTRRGFVGTLAAAGAALAMPRGVRAG
ncbi:MAG: twin-arginine translocation signal domain-containing protein, partial [Planctomycetes bacterium]|nr:twin-arginine translocation signal domain-containing protein [Planctomycetota bacterium]